LVSEGFTQIEEIAYVDLEEIAVIEGFDDETAQELQARATEFLQKEHAVLDAKRKEMGVADDITEFEGLTMKMIIALAGEGVKSVEDFAGCAVDDLTGWTERVDGENKHYDGMLEAFRIKPEVYEDMILRARLQAGWVTQEELDAEAAAAAAAEAETEAETAVEPA
ncbi:MAG: helix-hairpin-helix domain-containing protein, partial [Parvularculaceae bacterium]